jgi:O-antigen/teichoic acid export membrane protein
MLTKGWSRRHRPGPRERANASSIAVNSVAQTAPSFVGYIASFVSAPIILAGLGFKAYGLWVLTGGLATYSGLLDLGLGKAMSRFIAGYDAHNDQQAVGEVVAIGFLGSLLISLPILALALVLAGPIASAVGGTTTGTMRVLLLCSVGMTCLGMFVQALAAWPAGLRRMVAPNVAIAAGSLINFTFSVGAIAFGGGLTAYAYANLAASGVSVVVMWLVVRATDGVPPVAPPSLARFRHILTFAVKGQLVYVSDLINYQTDKIVVGVTVGPAATAAYYIANQVCAAARTIGVNAQSALVPSLSADVALDGTAALRRSYARLTQRSSAISFPWLVMGAASAPLLLTAWLGTQPVHGSVVLVVLSAAYLLNVSTGVSYAFAAAGGAIGIPAKAAVLTAVANVIATGVLAPFFGTWGVLVGTFAALTAGAAIQIFMVLRQFDIPFSTHWLAIRPPILLAMGLAVPVAAVAFLMDRSAGRIGLIAILAALGFFYFASYFLLAGRLELLPSAITKRLPLQHRRAEHV